MSENSNDVLPSGITFDSSTGMLSGTPSLGTVGIYTLNFTADNGIGTDAAQSFTLTIGEATPVITWNTPSAITYGTQLDSTELDAAAQILPAPLRLFPGGGDRAAGREYAAPGGDIHADQATARLTTVTQVVPIEVDPACLDGGPRTP